MKLHTVICRLTQMIIDHVPPYGQFTPMIPLDNLTVKSRRRHTCELTINPREEGKYSIYQGD